MKVYIAGKITGDKTYKDKFNNAVKILNNMGYNAVSPVDEALEEKIKSMDLDLFGIQAWRIFMKEGIKKLFKCDAICLLHDWKQSRGAKLEYKIAKDLYYDMFLLDNNELKIMSKSGENRDAERLRKKTQRAYATERQEMQKIVEKYMRQHNKMSQHALSKKIYNENNHMFDSIEQVRLMVRYRTGSKGMQIKSLQNTEFLDKNKKKLWEKLRGDL